MEQQLMEQTCKSGLKMIQRLKNGGWFKVSKVSAIFDFFLSGLEKWEIQGS
jgi:hypothetical protein